MKSIKTSKIERSRQFFWKRNINKKGERSECNGSEESIIQHYHTVKFVQSYWNIHTVAQYNLYNGMGWFMQLHTYSPYSCMDRFVQRIVSCLGFCVGIFLSIFVQICFSGIFIDYTIASLENCGGFIVSFI